MNNSDQRPQILLQAFDLFLENSPDWIFIKDAGLVYLAGSQAFARMAGLPDAMDLPGKTDFDIFSGELAERYVQDDRHVLESGVPILDHVEPVPHVDGHNNYSSTSKYVIRNRAGAVIGLYGVGRDVTAEIELLEEREARDLLVQRAETDSLTGLLNRESVLNRIREYLAGEGANRNHALLFIDLDCFKQVNDCYGHPFGDKILRKMGLKIQTLFSGNSFVGRIGGDEFLVFLKDVISEKVIEEHTPQIFNAISFCQREKGQEINVTCSIGVAMCRGGGKTVEQLYEEADRAMYQAKKNGRRGIVFY